MQTSAPTDLALQSNVDKQWMQLALDVARQAVAEDEVPVGAVIVCEGQVIAQAFNRPIILHDASAHAEILAIRAAGQLLCNYRLVNCSIYVTLEPCAMCAMAIMHARIKRLVYGAADTQSGACESVLHLFDEPRLNHHTQVLGGVLAEVSAMLLRQFFAQKRKPKASAQALAK